MIRRPPRSTLFSLHDALPISRGRFERVSSAAGCETFAWHCWHRNGRATMSRLSWLEPCGRWHSLRSEEHTSELQSRLHLVCRLLLEKKKPPVEVSVLWH